MGTHTASITWDVYKSDNTIAANHLVQKTTGQNKLVLTNAELQGYDDIYIRATSNCDGDVFQGPLTSIRISDLGKPSIYVSGPTNPYINSEAYYTLTGRNRNNVTWVIWTFGGTSGTFWERSPYGARIYWNSVPGMVRPEATATTACGSSSSGPYVFTHN